jgi:hypothetical protein
MEKRPFDLRAYAARTQRRLIWGGIGLIILIGSILILITYGTSAGVCGIAFFLIALIPVGLIAAILAVLQWIVQRANRES